MFSTKKQTDIYSNKLFANIDKKKVKFKFSSDKIITYKEGGIVFKKGDKNNYIYLIMEGEVKLKIPNPPFAPKIQFKYKNDFFGEKEVLGKTKRITSCVAEKACQLYPITYNELQDLISTSTIIKDNLEIVTITSEGKTLKEITQENSKNKETQEKIFTKENDSSKNKDLPEINITQENIPANEIINELQKKENKIEPPIENLIEENKKIKNEIKDDKTKDIKSDLQAKELPKEMESEEKKINDEKYLQIIDACHSLLMTSDVDALTQETVEQAKELVKSERCVFFFVNNEDKMLVAKIKKKDDQTTELKIPMAKSILGFCALKNETAIIDDVSQDNRFNTIYDEVFNYKTKNLLIIPISDKDENVIAALELINSKGDKFSEIDVEVLKIFSTSIVLALQNCTNIKNLLTISNEESLTSISKYIYNDIKNPLLTIKHYTNILIKDKIPNEIKQVLQLIIKQTDFIDSLNENLSSFKDEKINIKLKVFPFKETINDILGLLAEYSESRNIVLFKKIDVEAKVKLDPTNFMVACYKIIKNACDAQPNKGSVYITSTLVNGNVNIEFKDSGEGIPIDTQEQIFSKFSYFKDEKHIGVGLNIADKIIKEHGGKLTVLNSSEGGAIFTISLPVVK